MKMKTPAILAAAALMSVSQATPAYAYYGHHIWGPHNEGPVIGLLAVAGALTIGALAIATAPVRAVAEAGGPGYGPEPGFGGAPGYGPGPAYDGGYAYNAPPAYAPAPVYYARPRHAHYYYAPAPYYSAPYGRPYYGG